MRGLPTAFQRAVAALLSDFLIIAWARLFSCAVSNRCCSMALRSSQHGRLDRAGGIVVAGGTHPAAELVLARCTPTAVVLLRPCSALWMAALSFLAIEGWVVDEQTLAAGTLEATNILGRKTAATMVTRAHLRMSGHILTGGSRTP